jgi:hypothetical protein
MAGPVPAIHVLRSGNKDADARDKPGHDEVEKILTSLSNSILAIRLVIEPHQPLTEPTMTIITATAASRDADISKPARWTGRVLSSLVILFLLFDGAIKLVPWPIVTETMDKMGYGPSESLARSLGLITIVCTALYAVPPTSILGAILLTGYLGGAMASHVRIGSPLFSHTLFGFYLGLMVWGGLWLRDKNLRSLIPFRR